MLLIEVAVKLVDDLLVVIKFSAAADGVSAART
jgi:hypothetical protein